MRAERIMSVALPLLPPIAIGLADALTEFETDQSREDTSVGDAIISLIGDVQLHFGSDERPDYSEVMRLIIPLITSDVNQILRLRKGKVH